MCKSKFKFSKFNQIDNLSEIQINKQNEKLENELKELYKNYIFLHFDVELCIFSTIKHKNSTLKHCLPLLKTLSNLEKDKLRLKKNMTIADIKELLYSFNLLINNIDLLSESLNNITELCLNQNKYFKILLK